MPDSRQPWLWGRLLILSVTGVALFLVFRRLNLQALALTFRSMHWGWFLGSFVLYGALFLPAALRWHIVLRLTRQTVDFAATARLSLIGHFFYTVLLGVFGGDTAKSIVYSRWYRFPIANILATAPLDRFLGSVGMVAFGAMTLGVALVVGGFEHLHSVSLRWPGAWALTLIALVILLIIAGRFLQAITSFWNRFTDALGRGAKLLLASPRAAASGILCGIVVQISLSGALALNLRAATHAPLPWEQLLWTFPVVVAISALPLTFAGLGAREGAALTLFGLYGVPSEDAVGASLLMVATSLLWAILGGLLYWREVRVHGQSATRIPSEPISKQANSFLRRSHAPSPATRE
jgi:glycosyltransferase 2 family protein